MPDDVAQQTPANVDPNKPRRVTVDGQTVWSHELGPQLDAADREDAAVATQKKTRGLGFAKMRSQGPV